MANSSRREIQRSLAHERSKVALLVSPSVAETLAARHVRHVRKEIVRGLVPDFVTGPTTAVLLLSLQQHLLKPGYIYERINALRGSPQFRLNVLLLVMDTTDQKRCHELQTLCLLRNFTLLCCAGHREAGRYLECLRAYDGKVGDALLRGAAAESEHPLTAVRGVNKTDAVTLGYNLGSFRKIAEASAERLRDVPGLGDTKVARLHAAFNMPFRAVPSVDKDVEPEREYEDEIADIAQ